MNATALVRPHAALRKTCRDCGVRKTYAEFPANVTYKSGYSNSCKACTYIAQKARREANPTQRKASDEGYRIAHRVRVREASRRSYWKHRETKLIRGRQWRYGITIEEYQARKLTQCGVCAICGLAETAVIYGRVLDLCVDHDHKTGAIRGLLCRSCNYMIGNARDIPERLEKGAAYLRG